MYRLTKKYHAIWCYIFHLKHVNLNKRKVFNHKMEKPKYISNTQYINIEIEAGRWHWQTKYLPKLKILK